MPKNKPETTLAQFWNELALHFRDEIYDPAAMDYYNARPLTGNELLLSQYVWAANEWLAHGLPAIVPAIPDRFEEHVRGRFEHAANLAQAGKREEAANVLESLLALIDAEMPKRTPKSAQADSAPASQGGSGQNAAPVWSKPCSKTDAYEGESEQKEVTPPVGGQTTRAKVGRKKKPVTREEFQAYQLHKACPGTLEQLAEILSKETGERWYKSKVFRAVEKVETAIKKETLPVESFYSGGLQMQSNSLLTAEQIAARLSVSESTVKAWARSGRIPRVDVSPKIKRYSWPDVLAALQSDKEGAQDA